MPEPHVSSFVAVMAQASDLCQLRYSLGAIIIKELCTYRVSDDLRLVCATGSKLKSVILDDCRSANPSEMRRRHEEHSITIGRNTNALG